mgnify:CR=1 FL=1|tara:strand:+ start:4943 stop:5425 length:483 start_codon:yes stop_codon:yes gene_type:complete
MSQIDKHLKWCLKDSRRLVKIKSDLDLANKHIKKSEYNYKIMQNLEDQKTYDWALNIGFYAVYHCFLGILAKFGYDSKNQSCTITVLLKLIEESKIDLDKDYVMRFDTLEPEKDVANPTVREKRETSTYGVDTNIDLEQVKSLKEFIVKVQRETIRILNE